MKGEKENRLVIFLTIFLFHLLFRQGSLVARAGWRRGGTCGVSGSIWECGYPRAVSLAVPEVDGTHHTGQSGKRHFKSFVLLVEP